MIDGPTSPTADEVARAKAEGLTYSMANPYLTPIQKAQVEAVYQFPLGVMGIAFSLLTLVAHQSILNGYLNASFVGFLAWLAARYLPGRLFFIPVSIVTGGWGQTIIQLAFAGFALWQQRWALAAILMASAFGLTSPVELPMWLWHMAAGGIHAKYAIVRRMFGPVFPFQLVLDAAAKKA